MKTNALAPAELEEGTITMPFDMTVLNELDFFHLVMDIVDRLSETGETGIYLNRAH
jgi:xylulose-5-phosphate/fructose-6-phosphate phosphoketolase